MVVTVKLFAAAREIIGNAAIELELPSEATVADVRQQLRRRHPAIAALLAWSAMAMNHDFALDTDVIPANAELAVIPPVSGG